ncbi:hypothetical protein HFX_0431 [Haloferax mediterranei ATCC 33500]|uniref:C2H2-type domain-containing protein n=1 Tax=Haloferax mediterranei (strain ATCC 33500 / DSM 1411 / JCM 8866 / NBRC 14739 / NCIMB 2177 / R-4) TaxID=523841 RepID=I3R1Q6_HALMT|nr:hypothetical protein HFX_0431 [Haloferax mediterranei ATCC 33500]
MGSLSVALSDAEFECRRCCTALTSASRLRQHHPHIAVGIASCVADVMGTTYE